MDAGYTLPSLGGFAGSMLIYALVSGFITGPIIAERTTQKLGWPQQCARIVEADVSANQPPPQFTPNLNCNSLLGIFGREGQQLCREFGNFNLPLVDQLNDHQRRLEELREARRAQAANASAYRCECAVLLTQERRRIPFALYAGSARLITPTAIKNLPSELQTSLRSPLCAGKQ